MNRKEFVRLALMASAALYLPSCSKSKSADLTNEKPRILVGIEFLPTQKLSGVKPQDVMIDDGYARDNTPLLVITGDRKDGFKLSDSFGNLMTRDENGGLGPLPLFPSIVTPQSEIELSLLPSEIHELTLEDFVSTVLSQAKDETGQPMSSGDIKAFQDAFTDQWQNDPVSLNEKRWDLEVRYSENDGKMKGEILLNDKTYIVDADAISSIQKHSKGVYREQKAKFFYERGQSQYGSAMVSTIVPVNMSLSVTTQPDKTWETKIVEMDYRGTWRLRTPPDLQTEEEKQAQKPTVFEKYIELAAQGKTKPKAAPKP